MPRLASWRADVASPRGSRLVRVALAFVFALSAFVTWAEAWAHNPECSPMLTGSGPGTKLQSASIFGVRDPAIVGDYYNPRAALYVRADVTLGDAWHPSGWYQTLALFGSTATTGGGGLRATISAFNLGVGVKDMTTGVAATVDYSLNLSTRYELEFYFDIARQKVKIWVDGVEVSQPGGVGVSLYPINGYVTVGYTSHTGGDDFLQGTGGAIHSYELYDCTAPPEPFADRAALKLAVDYCLLAETSGHQCCSSDPVCDDPTDTNYRCGAAACNDMASWDVSKVTDMSDLFKLKTDFNQPIGAWDVSNVTNMNGMFNGNLHFNQPIGAWDVSKVTDMGGLLTGNTDFNQPIGAWDVSSVINMNHILAGVKSFNQPIGAWDVSSVENMGYALRGPSTFNQPIGGWNVSSVTTMEGMLAYTSSFNQRIGGWDVSSVTNMNYMFYGRSDLGYSVITYDITGWSTPSLTKSYRMFYDNFVWQEIYVRSTASTDHSGPPSAWSRKPNYCGEDEYVSSGACVACPRGTFNAPGDDTQGGVDTTCGSYPSRVFTSLDALKAAVAECADPCPDSIAWDVSQLTSLSEAFAGASGFNADISELDVSSVTTMDSMFRDATAFDADLTGWSSPQSAQNMFLGATAFLTKFANCNSTATQKDPIACLREEYPPSLNAFDGPPAAWDNRHCDLTASVVANGDPGECVSSVVPKGSMCAPTCFDPSALVVKGVCGTFAQTPPACVCECAEKMATFGFNAAP